MTLSTLISTRVMVKSRTSLLAGRNTWSVTLSPGLPLSAVIASASCIFLGGRTVDLENLVAAHESGLGGGGVLHRGNDDEHAVLRGNDEAQAVVTAAGVVLHVLEVVRLHELAVRVQAREHAAQGVVGQRAVIDFVLVHVVLADKLEHAGEDRQAGVNVVVLGGRFVGRRRRHLRGRAVAGAASCARRGRKGTRPRNADRNAVRRRGRMSMLVPSLARGTGKTIRRLRCRGGVWRRFCIGLLEAAGKLDQLGHAADLLLPGKASQNAAHF